MYGALRDREVVRDRLPRDVRRAESVHGDGMSLVVGPAAEERGVHEPASGWIELRDEGVAVTAEPRGESALVTGKSRGRFPRRGRRFRPYRPRCRTPSRCRRRRGVSSRRGPTRLSRASSRKSQPLLQGSVDHAVGGRELPRLRPACDIGVSGSVDGDRACAVVGRAPEVRARPAVPSDRTSPRARRAVDRRCRSRRGRMSYSCPRSRTSRGAGRTRAGSLSRRGGIAGVIDGEHIPDGLVPAGEDEGRVRDPESCRPVGVGVRLGARRAPRRGGW